MISTDDYEEGEILEDGEIVDHHNDNDNVDDHNDNCENVNGTNFKGTNDNFQGIMINDNSKFVSTSYHMIDGRNENLGFFGPKGSKRKKRTDRNGTNDNNNNNRKRKRTNSSNVDSNFATVHNKRNKSSLTQNQIRNIELAGLPVPLVSSSTSPPKPSSIAAAGAASTAVNNNNNDSLDITKYLNDSTYDQVELSDDELSSNESFKLIELIEFDVFMEILGCRIDEDCDEFKNNINQLPQERSKLMLRILKIMKKLHGNDPDTARRFARLKRRSKEKQNTSSTTDDASTTKSSVYKTACRFHGEGKCQKGNECLYSHEATIPKRKELCKFYLQGFCGKGDDCLFMHGEFPCKFFHTNTNCYSGENCRFSHAPLTPENREILRSYLDSGTFPDEVKPYRPMNNPNDWTKDSDDPDSNDYDYEALLSNKIRKVLLGPIDEKVKNSLQTWEWQQELKEAEKAYTGNKRNLFSIDDGLVLKEKPMIEEDEEVIEAHIQNYYQDLLDTDDYDEMIHLKEIEELEQKVKQEAEILKQQITTTTTLESQVEFPAPLEKPTTSPIQQSSIGEELSEEEKRLIEASMKDEDLRVLPNQPFTLPAAFGGPPPPSSTSQISNFPPSTSSYVNDFNPLPLPPANNPFGLPQPLLDGRSATGPKPVVVNNTELSKIAVQSQPQPPPPLPPPQDPRSRDPRIRDPRLNNSNRSMPNVSTAATNSSNSNQTDVITSSSASSSIIPTQPATSVTTKSEVKNQPKSNTDHLVITYKLFGIKIDTIDYSDYYESYRQDNSALKSDPRLKRFFENPPSSSPRIIKSNSNVENTDNNSLMTQECSFSKSPIEPCIGQKPLPKSTTTNNVIARDPRMRNRITDSEIRSSFDTKNSDSNTSIISTSSTDQTATSPSSSSLSATNSHRKSPNSNIQDMDSAVGSITTSNHHSKSNQIMSGQNVHNNLTEVGDKSNDQSSSTATIPSYALSALPATESLFSTISGSTLLPFSKPSSLDKSSSKLLMTDDNDDDDDDDDDRNQLKVDENPLIVSNNDDNDNDDDDRIKFWPKQSSNDNDKISQNNNNDGNYNNNEHNNNDDFVMSTSNNNDNDKKANINTTLANSSTFTVIDSSDNELEIDLEASSNTLDNDNTNDDNLNAQTSSSSCMNQYYDDDNQNNANNNNNNESESECENELIIAISSSENEDNMIDNSLNNDNDGNKS